MKKAILFVLMLLGFSQSMAQESEPGPLPIVREGVTWVNEKVIVNNGDTTSYYYKYEICGDDSIWISQEGKINKACYYYTGETLDVENDSLIANFDNILGGNGRVEGASCLRNEAYWQVDWDGNLLFRVSHYGEDLMLYWFEGTFNNPINYYLLCQEYLSNINIDERVLTRENFTEVEPVDIEGVSCRRWAYVKENGETMFYVVEGIGFDSWCMGDLLTPFTREPDHNADHQEWCGLSHVVKDGQIIYKGMRYRHGAFTGIDETVADQSRRPYDPNYYNLMGQSVGTEVPTTPGIYIHQGKKICVSRMP